MSISKLLVRNLTIGGLLVLQLLPAVSAEVPLTAFEANYKLYYGKMKAANARLSMAQTGDDWRWFLLTRPKGLLSLLTNKEPYSETIFTRIDGNHRIQQLTVADKGENDKQLETAKFDWNARQVEMLREGVAGTAPLENDVYDHLSIHLFSAKMLDENLQQASVDFYYKGRVVKSELNQLEKTSITIEENEIDVIVIGQSVEGSSTTYKYYYDPGTPFIPMKIISGKPDKKPVTWFYVPAK